MIELTEKLECLEELTKKTFEGIDKLIKKNKFKHIYFLDTNIVHGYPQAIEILAQEDMNSKNGNEPNLIIISDVVRRELNGLKKSTNIEKASDARVALNGINKYIQTNEKFSVDGFNIGVKFPRGSYMVLLPYSEQSGIFPKLRTEFKGDDQIISSAVALRVGLGDNNKGKVKIISDDNDMYTSCFQFNMPCSRFEEFYKDYDYTGFVEIEMDWSKNPKLCENLAAKKIDKLSIKLIKELTDQPIYPNEFIRFVGYKIDSNRPFRVDNEVKNAYFILHNYEKFMKEKEEDGVKFPYSAGWEQECALELLYDPNIDYVTLSGPPGGGKTILPIDVGLHMLRRENIYSILASSPPQQNSNIGFLPGTKEEKLKEENVKILDALNFLLGENKRMNISKDKVSEEVQGMIEKRKIEFETLSYIKGRTLSRKLILFDETEDYEPSQMRKLVSRLGNGSKMVFSGDPYQIDNPRCSKTRNGLVYLISQLKGQPNYAHLTLKETNYRHPRSQEIIKLLS